MMFWRRRGPTFLYPKRDLNAIYKAAMERAGSRGTDCLDLLTAALGARAVADVIRRLQVKPAAVAASAEGARVAYQPGPGLTDDARRVVEAVSDRALGLHREPSGLDLLVALASTDTAARNVLNSLGIEEPRVRALVG